MDPRTYVATINTLADAARALADIDPADLPVALAAESVVALAHAARLTDNALALVAGHVAASGVWAEDGAGSAAAWVVARTGSSHREATARLAAAHVAAEHPDFVDGFRSGATSVAHLAQVDRALRGPGPLKVERRHLFPEYSLALSRMAGEMDSGTFARALSEWTDAVDHAPTGRELDAISTRFLSFTEFRDTCLVEGSLPLTEGRLLKRRLEALVDAHFRDPGGARLDGRWSAGRPTVPPPDDPQVDDEQADDEQVDDEQVDDEQADDAHEMSGSAAAARGDEALAVAGGDATTRRSALMLDALLTLVDVAEAHPGAMPMLDGQPPQVLVIVPAERLPRRTLVDPRPRPLPAWWDGSPPDGPFIDHEPATSRPQGTSPPGAPPLGMTPPPGARPLGMPPPGPPPQGTPPSGAPSQGMPAPTSRPSRRVHSLVPPALTAVGGEGVPVDDATARWASCGHAEVRRLVLTTDGIVTDLGRTARVAGRDLRLRVALRDRWCRHPGCRVPALRCQAHHLVHWADGGPTSLANLYALCHRHHRLHHQWQAAGLLTVTGAPDGDLHFHDGAVHLGTTRPQPVHRLPRPDPVEPTGPGDRPADG